MSRPVKGSSRSSTAGRIARAPGDEDALALPAGQLTDGSLRKVAHADEGQGLLDGAEVRRPSAPEQPAPHGDGLEDGVADANREVPREFVALRHVADRAVGLDTAAGGDEPQDRADQRGLPGAVGSDEADELPGPGLQVDVLEDAAPAQGRAQSGDAQLAHCSPPRSTRPGSRSPEPSPWVGAESDEAGAASPRSSPGGGG